MTFLKNDPRPCPTLKQVILGRFELVVAHFGPPKIPKCLENGLFWDHGNQNTKLNQSRIGLFPNQSISSKGSLQRMVHV